jgi:two-component system sensor histidine kinase YesM
LVAYLLRKMNDIRLKNKLIFSFVFVVFVPVLMVGLYLTAEFRQMTLDNAIKQTQQNVERVKKRTSDILKVAVDISNGLFFDQRFHWVVNQRYERTYDVVAAYREYDEFQKWLGLNKEIANIRFYMDNPTLLNNWEFIRPDEEITSSAWYREALEHNGMIGWHYVRDETKKNREYLSLVRKIHFYNYNSYGVLVISLDGDHLNHILSQEPFWTMIADQNGNVVASNNQGWIGRSLAELQMETLSPGSYEQEVEGRASMVIVDDLNHAIGYNGLKIVSVFSIDSIVQEAERISLKGIFVIMISLVVALVLIYGVSRLLTKRLLKLSKQINKVSTGNLNTSLSIDGNDEIGLLARQFNMMVDSVKSLLEEVHESNRQKNQLLIQQNEIKLKMMASQINPHFLFNALESIRMKAHMHHEKEIAHVVKLLGRLMRKNLQIGGSDISLENELDMVRCYLEIQKFRYGERLKYEIDADARANAVMVPPLIVQPLVENAIVHGLENSEEDGWVCVTARVENGELRIVVEDNGVGMERTRLSEIESRLNDSEEDRENARIGLRNVHMRLKLKYGDPYGIRIESAPGQGTTVQLALPMGRSPYVQSADCG